MPENKRPGVRALILFATPKLADRAIALYQQAHIPVRYRVNAQGTASSEMMDLLGLGSIDRIAVITLVPASLTDYLLQKLRQELKLGTPNSGIAITIPVSSASSMAIRMSEAILPEYISPAIQKEESHLMSEMHYSLIAVNVNQGYSEAVMEAARSAGARGGTVIRGRAVLDDTALHFWNLSVNEEKETVLIITDGANRRTIMEAISSRCGYQSEAQGIVLSLPVEAMAGMGGQIMEAAAPEAAAEAPAAKPEA